MSYESVILSFFIFIWLLFFFYGKWTECFVEYFQVDGGSRRSLYGDGCPNYQLNQGHPTDFMKSPIHEELDGELSENLELNLFPNPTNGVIHLQRSDARAITGQIQIHTLQGVEVFRGAASSSLDLSGLPAGVYRVQLQTDFGRFSELLIVE
jgi:hypothetical protein